MAFGVATIAQLYWMVEFMNPERIVDIMILIGTNNVSKSSDAEEDQWESMLECLLTIVWQKFRCAELTVCTIPMSTRIQSSTGRRHNERVVRWNNIVRNLAGRNAGRIILMDLELELRALDQVRSTSDGIHFDSIEGQGLMNHVFQERLNELEVEPFDTEVLKTEEATNVPVIWTFVFANLEPRMGSVPAVPQVLQSSSE